jgi:hypothetical protein
MAIVLALATIVSFFIPSGPAAGAFRLDDTGSVNWYFATTALLRVPRLPLAQTRAYLDAYLAHRNPDGSIDDLTASNGTYVPTPPDSEDAYASTVLSLAARYCREAHDDRWWHAHLAQLEDLAYAELLTRFKPSGLIRVSGSNGTAYLMDNVEDYAGLRDFAAALAAHHDAQAGYVAAFVAPLGAAIHRLYDERARWYRWADVGPAGPLVPYPLCAAQLFPGFAHVSSGDPATDRRHAAGARETLARCRFSPQTSPDEALLYALTIRRLAAPSRHERLMLAGVRASHAFPDDIETVSLELALAG